MKKFLLSFAALCGSMLGASAQSRIETFTLESRVLGAPKTCSVYLPDGYDASQKNYPVLYLLHGASDDHTAWVERGQVRRIADAAFAEGVAQPMVIVMPDASGEGPNRTGRHMGYFDVEGWPYETFFFEEFMPAVERRYRIAGDKAHRAVAGLSMGGGGTVVYAMRHPELFGSACSLSGLLDTFPVPRKDDPAFLRSVTDNSPVRMLETLPEEEVAPWRTIRWWLDCGDEDFLYACNIRCYALMRERCIPLQYRMRDGGHTWQYWQTGLAQILPFISIGFAE